jgi:hypothetical protein
MITIEIDNQVFEKLKEIAIPFMEITPNLVIRRLLGLSNDGVVNIVSSKSYSEKSYKFYDSNRQDSMPSIGINTPSSENGIPTAIIDSLRNKRRITQQPILYREEYPFIERIERLREVSYEIHAAFLTFLMDKYFNTEGNYQTKNIIDFMEKMNLRSVSGVLRNPWMKAPYSGEKKGIISCQRTIEHYKQTRKFGCWGGRHLKINCDAFNVCEYHPDNISEMKNKCDLRKGVIWKRNNPNSPFRYGNNYLEVVKSELLNSKLIPLQPLLNVFYPNNNYDTNLVDQFIKDFHLTDDELICLFTK